MTRQPAISFSISFLSPFNRAGGRTFDVSLKNLLPVPLLAFQVAEVPNLRRTAFHQFRDPLYFPIDPRDFRDDLAGRVETANFDGAWRAHN